MAVGTHLDGADNLVRRIERLRGKYRSQPKVRVGYSAPYAVYVHENLEAHHPVGQAKFLEAAARRYRREMGAMVRRDMRRGGGEDAEHAARLPRHERKNGRRAAASHECFHHQEINSWRNRVIVHGVNRSNDRFV